MKRQLAIFSCLWFVIFCAVLAAVSTVQRVFCLAYHQMGAQLPLLARLLAGYSTEFGFVSSMIAAAVVACVNAAVIVRAYRMRDQCAARIFHGWALGIQAIALILFVCLAVIACSLSCVLR